LRFRVGVGRAESLTHICGTVEPAAGWPGPSVSYERYPDRLRRGPSADLAVSQLVNVEGWLPEHAALLTIPGRYPVHTEKLSQGKDSHWQDPWSTDGVFYSTVSGFKGLERPTVVIALNGFHKHVI